MSISFLFHFTNIISKSVYIRAIFVLANKQIPGKGNSLEVVLKNQK